MLKSILKAFLVIAMSLTLTNMAASQDRTSYCNNGVCTMSESVFDEVIETAYKAGQRKGKLEGCPTALLIPRYSSCRGGGSSHYEPGKIWAYMDIPSNFAGSRKFDLLKRSVGMGGEYDRYRFDLNDKVVTYTPGSGENKTTVELKAPHWFATVNLGETGRSLANWAQDASLWGMIGREGNFAIIEDMSQPFCSCR